MRQRPEPGGPPSRPGAGPSPQVDARAVWAAAGELPSLKPGRGLVSTLSLRGQRGLPGALLTLHRDSRRLGEQAQGDGAREGDAWNLCHQNALWVIVQLSVGRYDICFF